MKLLTNVDLNKNELQNFKIQNLAVAPQSPGVGQVYFNTADKKYYGFNGATWIDLSLFFSNKNILDAITAAFTVEEKNKLSGIEAGANKYSHPSNHPPSVITQDANNRFVSDTEKATWNNKAEKTLASAVIDGLMSKSDFTKLSGITPGATKTENSSKNGVILINGVEQTVYTHPSGSNPHGMTKGDLGLGNVENKSSSTIRDEITTANINKALGFTPKKIVEGFEKDRTPSTGSLVVYIALDTKKIWFDKEANNWLQIGGQDTIDWANVNNKPTSFPPNTHNHDDLYLGKTAKAESAKVADSVAWPNVSGKPNTFNPPLASTSTLGGIKVGANLTIGPDGVLNANDNPSHFIIKQETFTVAKGQTLFTLTKGKYLPNSNHIFWYMYGDKQSNEALNELSSTTFSIKGNLDEGTEMLVEYIELVNSLPYQSHANEHLTGGADAISKASNVTDGLMDKEDKSKLDGITANANKVDNSSKNGVILINGVEQNVYSHPNDANNRHVSDSEKSTWNAKETPQGSQAKADKALGDSKAYTESKSAETLNSAKGYTDNKVAAIVNTAPEALDTLQELAKALGNDPNFATTIAKQIGEKETPAGAQAKANVAENNAKALTNAHAGDNTRHITASERNYWNSRTGKAIFDIGDGKATEFLLKHNLNTKDLAIGIEEVATGEMVYTDVLKIDVNTIKVMFAQAPSSAQYKLTIIG